MISISKLFEVAPQTVEMVPGPTTGTPPIAPEAVSAEPVPQSGPSLLDVFPDLPDTADPCVLAEFFISKCDDVARGVPTEAEPKITQVPEPSEPGGRASIPVEITPKGVMPAG